MMKTVIMISMLLSCITAPSQDMRITGVVINAENKQPLQGASVVIYNSTKTTGTLTNGEGRFLMNAGNIDSLSISMIGHTSVIISRATIDKSPDLTIPMHIDASSLTEVIVKPLSALAIVKKCIAATKSLLSTADFENMIFYREVIKDKDQYYSVAEAVLKSQYYPRNQSFKLKMIKGRSKEDIAKSRLFEDFHPGGGPQGLVENDPTISMPDFLNTKKTKWFIYKNEPSTVYDGKPLYVISFDQRPGVKESLEKGKIFIDKEDFSIVKFEAESSPLGLPYIKHLRGSDKIMAELLNIDLKRKGWKRQAVFKKIEGKILIDHADAQYQLAFKQPKKAIDLDLVITTEFATTETTLQLKDTIHKSEEWKRKHMVSNLPTDFDPNFWGTYTTLSPTTQLENIISSINAAKNESSTSKIAAGWEHYKDDFFVAYQMNDSITIIPIKKGAWDDEETAGMIYKNMDSDFSIAALISVHKKTNTAEMPDNGFQQAGIIIRNPESKTGDHLILSIGTGGNVQPKIFLRNTGKGKSKGIVEKVVGMTHLVRLEKKGKMVTASYRSSSTEEWKTIDTYQLNWTVNTVQAGAMVMARFAGSGPKAKPDMKAVFTGLKIEKLN